MSSIARAAAFTADGQYLITSGEWHPYTVMQFKTTYFNASALRYDEQLPGMGKGERRS